jgi:beta-galactosidase
VRAEPSSPHSDRHLQRGRLPRATPDRATIPGDGKDLSFVTVAVADAGGRTVPRSMNPLRFEVTGPGDLVATENGDPTDMTPFPSAGRKAFKGLALAITLPPSCDPSS